MEPEGSLPSSQELSICTYPEPDQSSPQHSFEADTRWKCGELYDPAALTPRKYPQSPLDTMLRDPHSRPGRCGVGKSTLSPAKQPVIRRLSTEQSIFLHTSEGGPTPTELSPSREPPALQLLKSSQHFMEPQGSLPCSQEPSIGPYPEQHEPTPYHPVLYLKDLSYYYPHTCVLVFLVVYFLQYVTVLIQFMRASNVYFFMLVCLVLDLLPVFHQN
jgi:hypothetical protein